MAKLLDSPIQRCSTSAHGCFNALLQTHTYGVNGQGLLGWSSCVLGYRFLLITLVSTREGASFLLLEVIAVGGAVRGFEHPSQKLLLKCV